MAARHACPDDAEDAQQLRQPAHAGPLRCPASRNGAPVSHVPASSLQTCCRWCAPRCSCSCCHTGAFAWPPARQWKARNLAKAKRNCEEERQQVQATVRRTGGAPEPSDRGARSRDPKRGFGGASSVQVGPVWGRSAWNSGSAAQRVQRAHGVRRAVLAARRLHGLVKALQSAQRSVGDHCARGPLVALSGAKWRKQAKTAAGSLPGGLGGSGPSRRARLGPQAKRAIT